MVYYELLEGYTVTEDGDGAETFGVRVVETESRADGESSAANCIYQNHDITFSREEMLCHIELWNRLQPSLCHLMDLIEDIIEGNS